MTDTPLHRYRITYSRGAELRYVSHLDLQTAWERILRRTRLPVAFSQGFSPHPRFHMACALPLGFTSRCELADVWLTEALDADLVGSALQKAAPPGMVVLACAEIALNVPALQTVVLSAEYIARPFEIPAGLDLAEAVTRFLAADSLLRERRNKTYDLRPLVENLKVLEGDSGSVSAIFMRLSARESATARPEEVLLALGLEPTDARVERTALFLAEPAAQPA